MKQLETANSSEQRFHLLCINLETSTARREAMERQAEAHGLTLEIVPAVRGASLSESDRRPYARLPRKATWTRDLSPNEIGCFLSHRRALTKFLAGPADFAVILEDDARLEEGFNETLRRLTEIGPSLHAVRLETRLHDSQGETIAALGEGQALVIKRKGTLGGGATFYTRDAAETLLRRTSSFYEAFDNVLGRPWVCGATILELRRPVVTTGAFDSTIEDEKTQQEVTERRQKRERSWWRFVTGLHRKISKPLAIRHWRRRLRGACGTTG